MTAPVLRSSAGFIMKDHQREAFQTWAALRELGPALRIAVPDDPDALLAMQTMLPQAKKTTIADRDSLEELLSRGGPSIDAFVGPSERAAAWTILYPEYTLVVPKPVLFVPMGYAVAPGNGELRRSLDAWIAFEQAQGIIDEYYRYWMLGQPPQGERSHRWSVLRDVLHWVD